MAETKIERYERVKREQNPWDELPRLLADLRAGHGALAPDDVNTRLRWWGIYTQGDGSGALGGAAPYFMLRIRIPNGLLTAAQAAVIAQLARRYGRGLVDVTVRQNIQLHWLEAETLPDLLYALRQAGLTSQAACGDDPRNLTGCPLAGFDAEAYADASPLTLAANQALLASGNYYNLPRKFKVSISGCAHWCSNPEINDAAFTALPPPADGAAASGARGGARGASEHGPGPTPGEVRFGLWVGGGLATAPRLATPLAVSVGWDEVVPVACAIAALFRDCAELRQNRHQARLKYLFLRHHWTLARFRAELEQRLGFRLRDAAPAAPPPAGFRDHLGVHPQRQPGLVYAGLSVLRGRLNADQIEAVAEAAARWGRGAAGAGEGEVRATAMQNLLIPHVSAAGAPGLAAFLARWDLPLEASAFRRGMMSCTGKEFCKLAVVETKGFAAALIADLEHRLPGYAVPLKIHLNGCPNSCGQHWVADIGLQGALVKTSAGVEDGYDVYLGGALGADAAIARKTLGRVRALELADRLASLCRHFMDRRQADEPFAAFVRRQGAETLAAVLGSLPAAEPRPQFVRLAGAEVN